MKANYLSFKKNFTSEKKWKNMVSKSKKNINFFKNFYLKIIIYILKSSH